MIQNAVILRASYLFLERRQLSARLGLRRRLPFEPSQSGVASSGCWREPVGVHAEAGWEICASGGIGDFRQDYEPEGLPLWAVSSLGRPPEISVFCPGRPARYLCPDP